MGNIFYGGLKFEQADHLHGVRIWKQVQPVGLMPRMRIWRYLGSTQSGLAHLFVAYRGREIRVVQQIDLFKSGFDPFLLDLPLLREVYKKVYPK